MTIDFGKITAAARYTSNPISSQIIDQFNMVFGDQPGINLFMPEDAQHARALEEGKGENLFTTG